MKLRRFIKIITVTLLVCMITGVGLFMCNANHAYTVNSGFTSLPLNFNPDDSSSAYHYNGVDITVYGGFIKGLQQDRKQRDSLVIRALSPLPVIMLQATDQSVNNLSVTLENISPEGYAESIATGFKPVRTAVNTLMFSLNLNAREIKRIEPSQPDSTKDNQYIILGDSRDGYETFDEIIRQVDAIKPAFVINNGDLVFNGKPNQYRLFDKTISGLSVTLCTTLGNHDIRGSGRETYTMLYGPAYYSFDYGQNHFAFLDSSLGWSQKRAIPEEQYAWLERDLKKAQGKRIFVISHVPPTDPRGGTQPNEIQYYMDKVKQGDNYFEQKLDQYSENESINHGFQDKQEAERFENLMAASKVNTVYLSHIHSYFDYDKNGVRYVISGGAGAELLTKNSYYHYLISKAGARDSLTMVQLPSPPNRLLKRYASTASLFAKAMYEENRAAVILVLLGLILLALLILILLVVRFNHRLNLFWILIKDTGRFTLKRFKELYKR